MQNFSNGGNLGCVDWTSVAVSGAMGAMGSVGGGVLGRGIGLATGKEMAQNAVVRKLYNNKLAEGLGKNLNIEEAWKYRREVGREMKHITPLVSRYLVYGRNIITYKDRYGRTLKDTQVAAKKFMENGGTEADFVRKILVGTNKTLNKLQDSPIDIGKYADMGTKIGAGLGGLGGSASAVIRAPNTGGCGCE